jgi:ribonuclease HI
MTNFMGRVVIIADGGCSGNGTPNARAYGSFVYTAYRGDVVLKSYASGRLDYEQHHTNNEAEFQVCIDALELLIRNADGQRLAYEAEYRTDSQIVVNVLTGNWKCRAAHLLPLVEQARGYMSWFDHLTLVWIPREEVLCVLGH